MTRRSLEGDFWINLIEMGESVINWMVSAQDSYYWRSHVTPLINEKEIHTGNM